jgi:hypothetical protein
MMYGVELLFRSFLYKDAGDLLWYARFLCLPYTLVCSRAIGVVNLEVRVTRFGFSITFVRLLKNCPCFPI